MVVRDRFTDVRASHYMSTDNPPVPLPVRVRIFYPPSVDQMNDPGDASELRSDIGTLIADFRLTNIFNNTSIVRKMNTATFRYMRPVAIGFTADSADSNYSNFGGVMVTFRFRRVPPQGAGNGG